MAEGERKDDESGGKSMSEKLDNIKLREDQELVAEFWEEWGEIAIDLLLDRAELGLLRGSEILAAMERIAANRD